MPIVVKPASALVDKYRTRAGGAAGDYVTSVAQSQKDQAALAIAAKATWFAGLQLANTNDRYAKGLTRSGTVGWKNGVATKGATNYPTGVNAGAGKWATHTQPYFDAMSGLDLGPKAPKGDPSNYQRVQKVGTVLHAKKLAS